MKNLKIYGPLVAVFVVGVLGTVILVKANVDGAWLGILFVLTVAAAGWFSEPLAHEIYLRQQRSQHQR